MNTPQSASTVLDGEMSTVMPRIAALLAGSVDADRCAIFVYNEEQTAAIAIYRYGYDEEMRAVHGQTDGMSPWDIPVEAQVLRTGRPVQRRFPEDEVILPLANPGQDRVEGRLCDLVLPLIWNEQVVGASYIWRANNPTPYTDQDITAASAVGGLAALAIVFARQYQQEHVSRQRLDSLLDVATVATSDAEIDEILQYLAQAIRSATGADICSLYVLDADLESALYSYQDGVDEAERTILLQAHETLTSDIPSGVYARGTFEPRRIRAAARELPPGSAIAEFAIRRDVSEMLVVPIVFQGEMTGAVYAWYRDPERTFSAAAIEMAEGIANQAGGVVERARLHEVTRRQEAESDALLRIGQAVLSSETLDPVLEEIAGSLRDLIPYEYAYVGTLTEDGADIRVIREWGYNSVPILNELIPVEQSLSGLAVRESQVIHSGDVERDPRSWSQDPRSPILHSLIVAPLISDRGTLGTLFIGRESRNAFEPHDVRLLSLFSQHAALAIERMRDRETQLNRAQRDAFLAAAVDLLVSSTDIRSVLPEIARMACGVIADGVVIGLASWEYGKVEWTAASFHDREAEDELWSLLRQLEQHDVQDRLEQALRSDQEILVDEDALTADQEYLRPMFARLNVNQTMVVSLAQPERARGLMLMVSADTSPRFTCEDIELGRIIAHRIGDALERERVRRNQESMLRVAEALHGQLELVELEQILAQELTTILPCDQLFIGEVDRENGRIQPHVYRINGEDHGDDGAMPLEAGMCGETIRARQPIMDDRAEQREDRVYRDADEAEHYRQHGESALTAPLIVEDEVIGVLYISRRGHDRFTTSDLETFLLFAGMAGAALDQTFLLKHNRELYRASVEVLAAVVDAKDPMTLEHSRRVAYYSHLIATLLGLSDEQAGQIELAGLLHDIGKLGIPDRILRKPGSLTDDEFELIKKHPTWGADILERHPALTNLAPLVRYHHEWFDGFGYPEGLPGDWTPLGASVIAVADAFDTMTTQRTYQQRREMGDALNELERCSGTQFHPDIVQRFVLALRSDPTLMFGAQESP